MIKVDNLTKQFGKKIAVNDISFCANSGIITGLIGSNGSGKSTTMRMIATLLRQDKGCISIDGIDTIKYPQKAREKIGILLGGDVSLYERLTAKENILYFADLQNVERTVAEQRLNELVELLSMNDYIDHRVGGFSRGMRQKVAFARSIIHCPDVLLLDEPSTGLDINSIKDVQNFILYCKSQGKTILLSTHNAHEMERLCDSLLFIEEGKIVAQGAKSLLLQESGCNDTADLFFHYRERSKQQ